jgi:hypothetical protein
MRDGRRGAMAWIALAMLATGGLAPQLAPADTAPLASSVKAAFLYKFLSYIELPPTAFAQPDSPIVIGVAGADDVYEELARVVQGRSVGSRALAVRRLAEGASPAAVQLLFVGAAIDLARSPLVRRAHELHVPLVTDAPDGLAEGGLINFVMVQSRVRFEVSLEAAERDAVKVSSRVLSVAQRVVGPR